MFFCTNNTVSYRLYLRRILLLKMKQKHYLQVLCFFEHLLSKTHTRHRLHIPTWQHGICCLSPSIRGEFWAVPACSRSVTMRRTHIKHTWKFIVLNTAIVFRYLSQCTKVPELD